MKRIRRRETIESPPPEPFLDVAISMYDRIAESITTLSDTVLDMPSICAASLSWR